MKNSTSFATFGTYFDPGSILNVPKSADRSPHHHAGAAVLGLCRRAIQRADVLDASAR